MNKYALILPLVVLAFLWGYFSSCIKTEGIYLVSAVTASIAAILAVIAGYLQFIKHKKGGNK